MPANQPPSKLPTTSVKAPACWTCALIHEKDRMIHYWGNVVEGSVWIAIAGIIHGRTRRETDEELAKIAGRTKFALFWFGISDFIEITTGAWYKPIWLLIMKAVCVTVLLHCLAKYSDLKRRKKDFEQGHEG